jgi:hypothetical protein
MRLCGFEVGVDKPLFLIAGERRSAEQGPRGGFSRGCNRGDAHEGPALEVAA